MIKVQEGTKGVNMSDFRSDKKSEKSLSVSSEAILLGIVSIMAIALLIAVLKLNTSMFRVSYTFDEDGLERDICAAGITSIINKEPVEALVTDELLRYLERNDYPDFDFRIDEKDQIKHAELVGKRKCRILIQNPEVTKGLGLISLQVTMSESKSFEAKYKVGNYQELLLTKADLSLGEK